MNEIPKTHIATVSILVKERETHAGKVNEILSRHGESIISRLGVNLGRTGVRNYSGLITVVIEGTRADVKALTDELDGLYGIVAKECVLDE
jgi:metal-responsive CopG/Arc/MetJ family transcriptional regulator